MRDKRVSVVESVLSHIAIVAAVLFALYPVLWVVSTALSRGSAPERRVLPIPSGLTLDHLSQFLSGPHVLSQAASSLVVSIATAVVGIAIALPTAYALSRFTFVGKEAGVRLLLATQMFPMVASAVPLYIVLETLGLLDTRTGLVVCYATTSVPFTPLRVNSTVSLNSPSSTVHCMSNFCSTSSAHFQATLRALGRPSLCSR